MGSLYPAGGSAYPSRCRRGGVRLRGGAGAAPASGQTIGRSWGQEFVESAQERLASPVGKQRLVERKTYAEGTFGLAKELHGTRIVPGKHTRVTGMQQLDKVVHVDQGPIGRTPRSNPATYTGLFTPIRELFAQVKEARERG